MPGAGRRPPARVVTAASVALGLLGLAVTWQVTGRLERARPDTPPDLYWTLGVLGLLPAWLVEFVALLDRLGGRFPDMSIAAWWALSSAAAVMGVIAGHAWLRRLAAAAGDRPPARRCWLTGALTLPAAWLLAAVGLLAAGVD